MLGESAKLQVSPGQMETNDEPYQVASVLAKSINALGGPEHAADDLAWASSMPQGKALLEWLSSQVQCENLVSTGSETITYQASLQPIALHEQEILEFVLVTSLVTRSID